MCAACIFLHGFPVNMRRVADRNIIINTYSTGISMRAAYYILVDLHVRTCILVLIHIYAHIRMQEHTLALQNLCAHINPTKKRATQWNVWCALACRERVCVSPHGSPDLANCCCCCWPPYLVNSDMHNEMTCGRHMTTVKTRAGVHTNTNNRTWSHRVRPRPRL